jgi:YD repeat-containing protein
MVSDPVDLGTGLYVRSHDDIVQTGIPPIRFTRTYRARDTRSRAFGIGTSHSYDLFLVGDSVAFSWIEMIRDDGSRIRFTRTSPGQALADAVLEHTTTATEFFGATLRWTDQGWSMDLRDGSRYRFLACAGNVRPGQCGMYEYRDPAGRLLSLTRDGAGNLMSVTNADGYSVHFTYDRWHRIVRAHTGVGRLTMLVEYEYDAAGRLGRARSYWFDAVQTALNVVQWLTGVGLRRPGWAIETREYAYDDVHQMVEIREPGALVSNEYDAGGRVVRQVVNIDQVFAFAYRVDDRGQILETEVTQPDGGRYRVTFDRGVPVGKVYAPGTPAETQIVYEREPRSRRVVAIGVRCGAAGTRRREPVGRTEDAEAVEARLGQECGQAGTPAPAR